MLNSYLKLCEAISDKDLNKFIYLIENLKITDLNAFDSVLLRFASFHSLEITQYLLEKKASTIHEKWFDRLILNDLSLEMTKTFWDLGVRGESALIYALSNNANDDVLEFLIKNQALIKEHDEEEFLKNITRKKYLSLFNAYPFSDNLKNKLNQKFNNFPFKVNKKILNEINNNENYFDFLDINTLQNLTPKQLEKIVNSLKSKSNLKKSIEKLSLNQVATLSREMCDVIFKNITRKFNYLPKQLSSVIFLNQNIEYFLDNLEYNLDFSLFCYKKLIINQNLNAPLIKKYLSKLIKLDDIDYFLDLDPRLEPDYRQFSQNQKQLKALYNLEELKHLDCSHPSIFLKAINSKKTSKDTIKFLASQVNLTEKVIHEGCRNIDAILEFVKRKAAINLLNIYDENTFQKVIKLIENAHQYVSLSHYKPSDKIENYKTHFVLDLYLNDKIQSKVALYNILKTDKLNEKKVIELIEKDLSNGLEIHSWNYHHNIYGLKYLSNLNTLNHDNKKRLLHRHFSGLEFSKEEVMSLMENNKSYSFKLTIICVALNNNYPELLNDITVDELKKTIPYLNPNVKLETYLKVLKVSNMSDSLVAESIITNNSTLLEAIIIQKEKVLLEHVILPSYDKNLNKSRI